VTDSRSDAFVFFVDPVQKSHTSVYEYEPNTWGPSEVDEKVSPAEGWQNPIVTS
jgi:glucose-6-phosphate 1-dehydrogenase